MAMQSSGQIEISELVAEFGGSALTANVPIISSASKPGCSKVGIFIALSNFQR